MLVLQGLSYTYPLGDSPAVGPISGQVAAGTRLLITGASGSGKTTLVRLLAGQLQRHGVGTVGGAVTVDGRDPAACAPAERVRLLGLVGQEPADQLVSGTVADELAFALASACWTQEAIDARVEEVGHLIELVDRLADDPRQLSGGQQARVVAGAAVVGRPPVLLLDEPLAQLDGQASKALLVVLDRLAEAGAVVVMVEHRLTAALPWADRVWVLQNGALRLDLAASEVNAAALVSVDMEPPEGLVLVQTVRQRGGEVATLDAWGRCSESVAVVPVAQAPQISGDALLQASALRLVRGERTVLSHVNLTVRRGERVALLGANGTGKSTLLHALARDARVVRSGAVVSVPQDPDLSLYSETVRDELAEASRLRGEPWKAVVDRLAPWLGLDDLLDRSPHALSRGQRLRLAIGAALAVRPDVLLLDEPTSGQDARSVEQVLGLLRDDGPTLVFATHDVGVALRFATRLLVLDAGRVVLDAPPDSLLSALAAVPGLELPPVAQLCAARGWPVLSAADAASRLVP